MFHMPCFFFISGWLFKERYLDDVKAGLWKRVKGIYWPFLKWELIFLALHNLFSYCHLYRDSYSLTESLGKAGRILVMSRGEQLLGGYWFLIALFWTSILSLMLFYLQRRCNQLNINIISGG
jgi:fucose 4-O-acetylase-like acetyltransferase